MSESFDCYNAPQFFDFSRDLHKEEETDGYFEIDHENGELEDPLKCRDSEEIEQCIGSYIKVDVSDIKLETSKYSNSEEMEREEESSVQESIHSQMTPSPGEHIENETTDRKTLRRSISAGHLYPLCKTELSYEQHQTNRSNELSDLHESHKYCVKNNSMNNLKKSNSNASLNKNKAGPSRSSAPRLTRVASKENINKLAQPKRYYGSAQNLDQTGYVSMAEAVRKFQNGTPIRFRSKPTLEHAGNKLVRTIPQSPALLTKQRHRPVHAISREEQEQLEYKEAQKFKIKANPLNKRILQGPLKPLVPVSKKPPTIPEPFKITAASRKIPESPKKEVYEFHAKPVPKTLHEPPRLKEVKKSITKPLTPTFMKRYEKEPVKQEVPEENKASKNISKPLKTVPAPFSFEHRDRNLQKIKEERIKKVLEEEKKAREFHARPVPKVILNPTKNSSLQRTHSSNGINGLAKSDENISNQFKARPPTVLYKKPFEPKREERHLIEITEFQLNTELRAREREEFEQFKREKEERTALTKQLEEEKRLRVEEEEVARMRKEAEYKARPIKKYKEVKIEPSGKVTEPVSPKFHSNKHRIKENKENSNDNVL